MYASDAGWKGDAGTRRKGGTMCVHAAHVACQPAWQPGGLPSTSSSSLASKSEVPFLSFPLLSLSLSPDVSFPSIPSVFFSFLSEEEQCYGRERRGREVSSFLSNCSLLPGALPPTAPPAAGTGHRNRWATTENARRGLKAVSRDGIFPRDVDRSDQRTTRWPIKAIILSHSVLLLFY